jgi:trigger factor
MKTEFTDVSETQKTITIEIPSEVVDAEIDKVARDYSKQARLPGFRPARCRHGREAAVPRSDPPRRLAHAHPEGGDEALQERGIEPVDTPNIKDVDLREGQPLKFTAAIETVPPFDPGDLTTISLERRPTVSPTRRSSRHCSGCANRAAKSEPVEGRPVADADTVVLDIERKDADGAKATSTKM